MTTDWLRPLVASFSQQRQGSAHVGLVDKVALEQVFFYVFFGFPYQYHSTMAVHTRMSHGNE
jgi:hypothetical protein